MLKRSEAATVPHIRLWTVQIPLSSAASLQFYKVWSSKCFLSPPGTKGHVRNVEQILCRILASFPTPGCR